MSEHSDVLWVNVESATIWIFSKNQYELPFQNCDGFHYWQYSRNSVGLDTINVHISKLTVFGYLIFRNLWRPIRNFRKMDKMKTKHWWSCSLTSPTSIANWSTPYSTNFHKTVGEKFHSLGVLKTFHLLSFYDAFPIKKRGVLEHKKSFTQLLLDQGVSGRGLTFSFEFYSAADDSSLLKKTLRVFCSRRSFSFFYVFSLF